VKGNGLRADHVEAQQDSCWETQDDRVLSARGGRKMEMYVLVGISVDVVVILCGRSISKGERCWSMCSIRLYVGLVAESASAVGESGLDTLLTKILALQRAGMTKLVRDYSRR
jgi:hypothetical protein